MRAHRRHENNASLSKQERNSQQQCYGKQLQHCTVANLGILEFNCWGAPKYSTFEIHLYALTSAVAIRMCDGLPNSVQAK